MRKNCECANCQAVAYIDRVLLHIESWWPQPEDRSDPYGGPNEGCAEFDPGQQHTGITW